MDIKNSRDYNDYDLEYMDIEDFMEENEKLINHALSERKEAEQLLWGKILIRLLDTIRIQHEQIKKMNSKLTQIGYSVDY